MRCCRASRSAPESALAERAEALGPLPALPVPQRFPMYVVRMETFLGMTEMRSHQELKKRGELVEYDEAMGSAVFISHQCRDIFQLQK